MRRSLLLIGAAWLTIGALSQAQPAGQKKQSLRLNERSLANSATVAGEIRQKESFASDRLPSIRSIVRGQNSCCEPNSQCGNDHIVTIPQVAQHAQPPVHTTQKITLVESIHESAPPANGKTAPAANLNVSYDASCCPSANWDACCAVPCCYNYAHCGNSWVRADYLLWWTDGMNLPPLLTTSPTGTPVGQAGVLGQPGTSILFGGSEVHDDARSGGRFVLGHWFDDCQTLGIEGSFFFLESDGDSFSIESGGDPIVGRPFFNAQTGQNDVLYVAFPNIVAGSAHISTSTEVWGWDINLRENIYCDPCSRIDLLGGFRFLGVDDEVNIRETEINLTTATQIPVGTRIDLFDSFETENRFTGGQIGVVYEKRSCRWTFEFLAKLALGSNTRRVRVTGGQIITTPGAATSTAEAGFLALPSNSGFRGDTTFAVVPELGLNIGYQITDCLSAKLGYSFIYLTDAVRAGDQIDLGVNPTQIPPGDLMGAARPAPLFNESDFWAQGFNFSMELRF